jgi:hypothetical protein
MGVNVGLSTEVEVFISIFHNVDSHGKSYGNPDGKGTFPSLSLSLSLSLPLSLYLYLSLSLSLSPSPSRSSLLLSVSRPVVSANTTSTSTPNREGFRRR